MMFSEDIEIFNDSKEALSTRIKNVLKDEYIPLSQRWELYCNIPLELLEEEQWVIHLDCEKLLPTNEISWYDDFYIDRSTTVKLKNIGDQIADKIADGEAGFTNEFLDAFQREVLEKGLGSFVMDW